ncbi:MAG: SgcJ/EcaC family oxidoreductase [Gemmatimonadales bacterium]
MRCSLVALCTLLLVACAPVGQQDTETDAAAIRAVLADFDALANAGNAAGIAELYAEDAIQMPPDAPSRVGRGAILASMEETFGANTLQLTSIADEIEVAGDLAFVRITWDEGITPKAGGDTEQMHGNWLVIFKRQADGSWKMWRDMWSVFELPEA